ncbi:EF-P beta-lysylation protein EpmB [Thiohalospira sp.]|uniref:EF-P beta-lysylation protein EpmB n=1 Tax=Thiohalospira sp. TaxID=3080549 RepID=UPI0039802422
MIARTAAPAQNPPLWQRQAAEAVRDADTLWRLLELPAEGLPAARAAAATFGLRVPRPYLARMRPGEPDDPLLRQVLPVAAELAPAPMGFTADPVGDGPAQRETGLLQKYHGRALLLASGACGVHCRYCFRRHYPYAEAGAGRWEAALAAIAADPSLEEVILSGGDPLSLADHRLADLVAAIEAIPHVRRLRLHTRQPVVLPARVDAQLLEWLGGTRLATVVVWHVNHAREIDTEVAAAAGRLREAGATQLNQAVLLAGVNDSVEAQAELATASLDAGILPYYLHTLDRVAGAAHFESDVDTAALMEGLRRRLPGYLVPRLVREEAGGAYKTPLD